MRISKLIPLFFLLIFVFSFTAKINKKKIIAVFDRDPVLHKMAGYKKVQDSLVKFRLECENEELAMFLQMGKVRKRIDTSDNLSPIIRNVLEEELEAYRQRIGEFSVYSKYEALSLERYLLYPLNDSIDKTAASICVRNRKPDKVMDKKQLADSLDSYWNYKQVDITKQIFAKLGLKKKQ